MSDIKDQLDSLQEAIYDSGNYEDYFLRYTVEGNVEAIALVILKYDMDIEVGIWNSDNEERNWFDETNTYEDLKPFLKKKIEDCLMAFTELKGILNK